MLRTRAPLKGCGSLLSVHNLIRPTHHSQTKLFNANASFEPCLAWGSISTRTFHATGITFKDTAAVPDNARRTICIKNIPRTVSPARLKYHFGVFGDIEQIDRPVELTGMGNTLSTKYAFIKFATPQSANEALNFDKTRAFGSYIHVELAKADAQKRQGDNRAGEVVDTGPNSRTIVIFNLHKDVDDARLGSVFSLFGKVENVHRAFDSLKKRHGNFAYVRFADVKAATEALSMDGMKIHGRTVFVERKNPEPEPAEDSSAKATIAVTNCGPEVNPDAIRSVFEQAGGILGAWPTARGNGVYLQFANPQGAKKALDLNRKDFHGHSLEVKYAQRQIPLPTPTRTLALSKLPEGTTEQMLRKALSSFGTITAVHIPATVATGEPRRYALVQFKDVHSTMKALEGAANKEFMGVKPRLSYGRFTPKSTESQANVGEDEQPTKRSLANETS
ncbi:Protein phosphatase PP2A regulatory subunit B [Tulasnella sp. 418]|nr:Protein phosphatase PP2A regulatory subunit B [Tulasnella sp. 418]